MSKEPEKKTQKEVKSVESKARLRENSPKAMIFASNSSDLVPTFSLDSKISQPDALTVEDLPITVDLFTLEDAKNYVLKITGIKNEEKAVKELIDILASIKNDEEEKKPIDSPICLPLTIAMACHYIKERQITIGLYLKEYKKRKKKLLSESNIGVKHDPVSTTWNVTMDIIKETNEQSFQLLQICTLLHPNNIQRNLLETVLKENKATKGEEDKIIGLLVNYSMLNVRKKEGDDIEYSMHRFIQEVILLNLNDSERGKLISKACKLFNSALPYDPAVAIKNNRDWIVHYSHILENHILESKNNSREIYYCIYYIVWAEILKACDKNLQLASRCIEKQYAVAKKLFDEEQSDSNQVSIIQSISNFGHIFSRFPQKNSVNYVIPLFEIGLTLLNNLTINPNEEIIQTNIYAERTYIYWGLGNHYYWYGKDKEDLEKARQFYNLLLTEILKVNDFDMGCYVCVAYESLASSTFEISGDKEITKALGYIVTSFQQVKKLKAKDKQPVHGYFLDTFNVIGEIYANSNVVELAQKEWNEINSILKDDYDIEVFNSNIDMAISIHKFALKERIKEHSPDNAKHSKIAETQ